MNTKIHLIQTDAFKMQYFRFGASGKPPIVIIPGLSVKSVCQSADAIVDAYRIFDDDYDVYLLDRRSDPPEGYTVPDMARDTAAAMKALGIYGASIISVSQGGMIAQILAAEYPELARAVVLGSTVSRVTERSADRIRAWIDLAEKGDLEALTTAFAEDVYSEQTLKRFMDVISASSQGTTKDDLRRFVIFAKAAEGFDFSGRLSGIKCPALVLGGKKDKIFDEDEIRRLAQKLGCEAYLYEGYGHAVYDEAPDYLKRAYDFFKSCR
ncbi:MAG: alpha/beta hydrolase [Clostridia bacterium]|nr:alpha/beta hydrolase [Clostridia bacterium]